MANTFDSKILSRNAIVLREIDAKQKNAKKPCKLRTYKVLLVLCFLFRCHMIF